MNTSSMRRAILFADISVNEVLYEKIGDDLIRRLVNNCIGLLTEQVERYHGMLHKTIVNEILCSFDNVEDAFQAACGMQQAVSQSLLGGEYPLHVRIGFHYGEVTLDENGISGDAIAVAARVTAITRARQIMATLQASEALPSRLRSKVRKVMRAKGRAEQNQIEIFLVTWEHDDTTISRVGLPKLREPREARNELLLRYHQQLVVVNSQRPSVVLGRGDSCDLVIRDSQASRQHARIELYYNKFVFFDYSANGSYIRFADKRMAQVLHQEINLHGSGSISLGRPFSEEPTETIDFILQ